MHSRILSFNYMYMLGLLFVFVVYIDGLKYCSAYGQAAVVDMDKYYTIGKDNYNSNKRYDPFAIYDNYENSSNNDGSFGFNNKEKDKSLTSSYIYGWYKGTSSDNNNANYYNSSAAAATSRCSDRDLDYWRKEPTGTYGSINNSYTNNSYSNSNNTTLEQYRYIDRPPALLPCSSNCSNDSNSGGSINGTNDADVVLQLSSSSVRPVIKEDGVAERHPRNSYNSHIGTATTTTTTDGKSAVDAIYVTHHHPCSPRRRFLDFIALKLLLLVATWMVVTLFWLLMFPTTLCPTTILEALSFLASAQDNDSSGDSSQSNGTGVEVDQQQYDNQWDIEFFFLIAQVMLFVLTMVWCAWIIQVSSSLYYIYRSSFAKLVQH